MLLDPSLDTEGFIHCSYDSQVLLPANALFSGRDDLVLLAINPEKLKSDLVIEDSYNSGTAFPHVYGPIEVDAVYRVVDFPSNSDGQFSLPQDL